MFHVCFTCGWEPHTQKPSGHLLRISQRTDIHCSNAHTVLLLFLSNVIFAANSKSPIHTVSSEHFMFEIFGSKHFVFGRCREGEGLVSACVVPTSRHGGKSEMVWDCFPMTLLVIYSKFKARLN